MLAFHTLTDNYYVYYRFYIPPNNPCYGIPCTVILSSVVMPFFGAKFSENTEKKHIYSVNSYGSSSSILNNYFLTNLVFE